MDTEKVKNVKISKTSHDLLKSYCDDRGLKIYKFLEKLIVTLKKIYRVTIKLRLFYKQ